MEHTLTMELEAVLRQAGAVLVGFGALTDVPGCPLPCGVSVALPIPVEVLRDIQEGPTRLYYECYVDLNRKLDQIVSQGARFLESRGYAALARTTDRIQRDETERTDLPHKTVALRAGLGWIGKSNLLVTPAFGGAVRISSLLTDAPLDCRTEGVAESRCGACRACADACPAGAIHGADWHPGCDRDDLVDYLRCREKARALMASRAGVDADICGQCFVACPYTREYVRRALAEPV